jgi:hypothetical protein
MPDTLCAASDDCRKEAEMNRQMLYSLGKGSYRGLGHIFGKQRHGSELGKRSRTHIAGRGTERSNHRDRI